MKMLYSMGELGKEESEIQIGSIMDRNIKLENQAEKLKNKDRVGITSFSVSDSYVYRCCENYDRYASDDFGFHIGSFKCNAKRRCIMKLMFSELGECIILYHLCGYLCDL